MRKIEKDMLHAVHTATPWQSQNTAVAIDNEKREALIYLHGNHIATASLDPIGESRRVRANRQTFMAWPTRTTTSRLQALGIQANIKNGRPHLNGRPVEVAS